MFPSSHSTVQSCMIKKVSKEGGNFNAIYMINLKYLGFFFFLMNQLLIYLVCFGRITVMTLVLVYFPHCESRPDVRHKYRSHANSLTVQF